MMLLVVHESVYCPASLDNVDIQKCRKRCRNFVGLLRGNNNRKIVNCNYEGHTDNRTECEKCAGKYECQEVLHAKS